MTQISNTKRIAKNTVFLYMRMLLSIVISLFTVRVVWRVLGIEDYGVYNVVGGVITMFEFLKSAMITSSQRFMAYEMGRQGNGLQKIFSLSLSVHFILAIIIAIIAETIGLWFINCKLNIPINRIYAANWVYQCTVISFLINVISVPYNACIVAHEHMKAYGYFGIIEVALKLGIVFLLMLIPGDKLIIYSLLVMVVYGLMRLIVGIYCRHNFKECSYTYVKESTLMRQMFSFIGWSFMGNLGYSIRDQGLNILINLMYSVSVNAAKGVASQVGSVINGFASNFQMALSPQITKSYASGDLKSMIQLVFSGCRYSVLLMIIITIPLIISAEQLLHFWLGDIAPYTVSFLHLTLIMSLVESITNPLTTSIQATGKIKIFQILISILMILNVPLSWLWMKFMPNPTIVIVVCIITSIIAVGVRLIIVHKMIWFSYTCFFKTVILRLSIVAVLSLLIDKFLYNLFSKNLTALVGYEIVAVITSLIIVFFVGLNIRERKFAYKYLTNKLQKFHS